MNTFNLSLVRRCDDHMWSYQLENHPSGFREVRVVIENQDREPFRLAGSMLQFLTGHLQQSSNYYKVEFTRPPFAGRWLVENITESWYLKQLSNSLAAFSKGSISEGRFPLITVPTPRGAMKTVSIWRVFSGSWGTALTQLPTTTHLYNSIVNTFEDDMRGDAYIVDEPSPLTVSLPPSTSDEERIVSFLENGCFQDPFTVLASRALQQKETHFVSENILQGDLVYVLEGNILSLDYFKDCKVSRAAGITAAKDLYSEYVRRVYGDTGINSARLNLQLSLRDLKAVVPDEVFKFNMASQFVLNMRHLHKFLEKFKHVTPHDERTVSLDSWEDFHRDFLLTGISLPLKPIRGLYQWIIDARWESPVPLQKMASLLQDAQGNQISYLKDLPLAKCNDLLKIILHGFALTPHAFEANRNFFTGRQIEHLAICGYKTMGDRTKFDPTRNWFEALHIYPLLCRGNWEDSSAQIAFFELLAHVIVKKSLLDADPDQPQKRCTGRFIPAPQLYGHTTWYSITAFVNDGGGDLNYILRPVSKEAEIRGKRLPFIKLFRSTASDLEAEDHALSIEADLNFDGVGSLDENSGDSYEEKDFYRCTMPLWLGYLIAGDVKEAQKAFMQYPPKKDLLNGNFPTWEEESIVGDKKEVVACLARLRKEGENQTEAQRLWDKFENPGDDSDLSPKEKQDLQDLPALIKVLFELSPNRDEWTKALEEIRQDIVFTGHSLGGALAQQSMVHFLVDKGRIPLPGCSYRCICFDSPGTDYKRSARFTQFMHMHRELFSRLNTEIELAFYFENKDTIPTGGDLFLGTQEETEDQLTSSNGRVINFHAEVREVLSDEATALELTTIPIHGKRFGYITEGVRTTSIGVRVLRDLKINWGSSDEGKNLMGWNGLPWMVEKGRKSIGMGTAAVRSVKKLWSSPIKSDEATRVQELFLA